MGIRDLLICFLLIIGVVSCDNSTTSKTDTNDSVSNKKKSDTLKGANVSANGGGQEAFVDITVNQFRINREDLQDEYDDSQRKIKLLVLKTGFSNLTNPSSLHLLIYAAKDHKDHGKNQTPYSRVTTEGTKVISSNIIIGNNYVDLKAILKTGNVDRSFSYLLFKPTTNSERFPGHLVYQLIAVTVRKQGAQDILSEEDLGVSNPSPPAPPFDSL